MDHDSQAQGRLRAFKAQLRDQHVVDIFSSPEDLALKVSSDFKKHFEPKQPEKGSSDDEFAKSAHLLKEFRFVPKLYNGQEVRLRLSVHSPFPANRGLCSAFNLPYGATIGVYIGKMLSPDGASGPRGLYATGKLVDALLEAIAAGQGTVDLYAQLQFTESVVSQTQAEFFGQSVYRVQADPPDDGLIWVPAEGTTILLFVKAA